jgi:hypothetical protein
MKGFPGPGKSFMEASGRLRHGAGCMVASGSLSMQLEAKKLKKYFKATPWFRFLSLVSVFVCFAY